MVSVKSNGKSQLGDKIMNSLTKEKLLISCLIIAVAALSPPASAQIEIPTNTTVGNWDGNTRTYTLTTDVAQMLIIVESDLVLDGNGRSITWLDGKPPYPASGVFADGKSQVTIKNLNVSNFVSGIRLIGCTSCTVSANTCNNNTKLGIDASGTTNSKLTGNTANYNNSSGIGIWGGSDNILTDNTATYNLNRGIRIANSSNNSLTDNMVSENSLLGIELTDSSNNNTLTGNAISYNGSHGILVDDFCSNNTVNSNDSSINDGAGIWLTGANYNILSLNTCNSNNVDGIWVGDSSNNNNIDDNICNSNFYSGICLYSCSENGVTGNSVSNNSAGIHLGSSNNNTLATNTCKSNGWVGIELKSSNYNALNENTCNSNDYSGIFLEDCSNNTITSNIAKYNVNRNGIELGTSDSNIITDNTTNSNNKGCGIYLSTSSDNTLAGNSSSDNKQGILIKGSSNYNEICTNSIVSSAFFGISILDSANNQIFNNNFIDNAAQVNVKNGSGNVFDLPAPVGGNYWSDWTSPDTNEDGIVDVPYVFTSGQDNLPFASQDGWLYPPVGDGVPDEIEDNAPNGGDGNNDGIPDSEQAYVASLPNAVDGEYVSVVSPSETALENVQAVSPAYPPEGVEFPVGIFEFTVSGVEIGGSTIIEILLPAGVPVESYYKYGPTTGDLTPHWYEFLYDGTTGAEILSDRVILHLVDGQRGDDDLVANGEILEPGGPSPSLNTTPVATITQPTSGFVVSVGTAAEFEGTIYDPDEGDMHTAVWTVGGIDYTGDVDGSNVAGLVEFSEAGIYSVTLTVTDRWGRSHTADTVEGMPAFVVVYDPDGGFVTGGGWIESPAGAYVPDQSLFGKANFGFVSKYKKGATVPTGQTEFVFQTADVDFHSDSYDWLVVTGSNYARFKGTGTIKDYPGSYKFMLWAGDGDPDTFRIKIWSEEDDIDLYTVYDNGMGQPISCGSIIVHDD